MEPNQPPEEREPAEGAMGGGLADPVRWVDEYGDYLFRFALVRLRDETVAEDMVQETFLAALKAGNGFEGRSSPRSWLVGILKNKIVDHFRKASRETSFTDLESLGDEQSERFQQEGIFRDGWVHELGPLEWGEGPGDGVDREAFWRVFHECSAKLPHKVSRVFVLREVDEISTDEICALLQISPNNLWVMLHRARQALRRCLEANWFARGEGDAG